MCWSMQYYYNLYMIVWMKSISLTGISYLSVDIFKYDSIMFLRFYFQPIWFWQSRFWSVVTPRRFYLTVGMMNVYSFIPGLLEWLFSELFSANVSLWNQYKYISFNIFSSRILIIVSATRRRRDIEIPLCLSAPVRKSLL